MNSLVRMETCQIHPNTEVINGEQTEMLLETQTENDVRWTEDSQSEIVKIQTEADEQMVDSENQIVVENGLTALKAHLDDDSLDHSVNLEYSTEDVQDHVGDYTDVMNPPDLYEATSYHELRCLSNEEHGDVIPHFLPVDNTEFSELAAIKDQASLDYRYRRFYRNYTENGTAQCIENTDDQLFIEIVKEDISLNNDPDEETSIFDSISFNIEDNADSMTTIKILRSESDVSAAESSRYQLYKDPPIITPEVTKVVRMKERRRRHRKPEGLANYRSLITEAINSSPDKRMILTDIYKYIIEHVPFFKDGESGDREGWKNCVRHTLSVNERFMRVRNRDNGRSSYWTVCEEGEFATKFADLPWVSEIYKPEERKRVRTKKELVTPTEKDKAQPKEPPAKKLPKTQINGKLHAKKVKKKEVRLKTPKSLENLKPTPKTKEKNLKAKPKVTENGRRQKNNTDKINVKAKVKSVQKEKISNKIISRKIHKTKKNVKKKVLPKTNRKQKAGTKKSSNKSQDNNDKADVVRKSGRSKAVRNSKY